MKPQISHGAYVATFYRSKDGPLIYHAVITKQGSPEIISWTQCPTFEECERSAVETMRSLTNRSRKKRA